VRIEVEAQIAISRPRSVVAAFASDPENAPIWQQDPKGVRWINEPPLRVGSEFAFVDGGEASPVFEVREFVENESLVMAAIESSVEIGLGYAWSDMDSGGDSYEDSLPVCDESWPGWGKAGSGHPGRPGLAASGGRVGGHV
jgi:hypothetical protein